jgi:hypothetical protein
MESVFDDMDEDDTQTKISNCMNATGIKNELCNTMQSTPRRHGGVDAVDKTSLLFNSDRGGGGKVNAGEKDADGNRPIANLDLAAWQHPSDVNTGEVRIYRKELRRYTDANRIFRYYGFRVSRTTTYHLVFS